MAYRVEIAPNGRAGCKATTCGKAKIGKGELRLGTWVKGPNFESWSWRHWGCFTPRQIAGARKGLLPEGEEDEEGKEVDMNLFDGWGELTDELKDKVKIAMEVGHVDDQDWKGDVSLNRKGVKKTAAKAKGKSAPAAKKGKKDDGDGDEEEEAVETDEEPAPKKSTKKSATAPKKRTPAKKSTPAPTPSPAASPAASPERVKSKKATTSKKATKSATVAEPTRPRSSRATAATPKKYTEVNESADDDSPPTTRKPRTTVAPTRNLKSAKDGKKNVGKGRGKKTDGDSDTEDEDAEMVLHADDDIEEDAADLPPLKAQSRGMDGGRKRKATATVDVVRDEVGEEEEQPKKKRTKAKPTPSKKDQSAKTKKATTTTPASDKKSKVKAKDSAKGAPEAKDKSEARKSIFGGE